MKHFFLLHFFGNHLMKRDESVEHDVEDII